MIQFDIKVNTVNGAEVKVRCKQSLTPNGLFKFDFYVPSKYELSYIIGNNCYINKMGTLVNSHKYYTTARVVKVTYLGKIVKNKKGDIVKYTPHVTNCVTIEAMPSEVMCMDIDSREVVDMRPIANRLFDIFCKIK